MSKQKIKDYITQIRGVSYKPADVVDAENGTPIIRANNIQDDGMIYDDLVFVTQQRIKDNQLLKKGDIVICTSSGSKNLVGKATTFNGYKTDMSFGAFCKGVRISDSSVNPDFIRLFFKSKTYREQISASSTGANINNIKTEHIDNLIINIPPVETQNIAVGELFTLIKSISIKKQQLSALNDLVKSRFIEMFGDPVENPKGWVKKPLSDECEIITGNTPSRKKADYYGNFIEWIKSDNINTPSALLTTASEFLSEEGLKVGRSVEKDCILMTCIAGSIGCIGNVSVTDRKVAFNQQINGIIPNKNNVWYLYVLFELSKSYIQSTVTMALKGILSKGQLSKIEFIFPPIELQNEFAEFVKLIDKSKFIVQKQIEDLQELLDSKMDEYFG